MCERGDDAEEVEAGEMGGDPAAREAFWAEVDELRDAQQRRGDACPHPRSIRRFGGRCEWCDTDVDAEDDLW